MQHQFRRQIYTRLCFYELSRRVCCTIFYRKQNSLPMVRQSFFLLLLTCHITWNKTRKILWNVDENARNKQGKVPEVRVLDGPHHELLVHVVRRLRHRYLQQQQHYHTTILYVQEVMSNLSGILPEENGQDILDIQSSWLSLSRWKVDCYHHSYTAAKNIFRSYARG